MENRSWVFVVVVWAGLCGVGPADESEDRAVAAIKKLGGTFGRFEEQPDTPVVWVSLHETKATDADLKELAPFLTPLKSLTALNLYGTEVTDTGLKELAPFRGLNSLRLDDTKVTDAGLKELAPLKELTTLSLMRTQVTDVRLKQLAPLKKLTRLELSGTEVTEEGAEELRRLLPNCKILR